MGDLEAAFQCVCRKGCGAEGRLVAQGQVSLYSFFCHQWLQYSRAVGWLDSCVLTICQVV